MRLSKMHLKTLREVPNEAEIPSHILLLRTGMIRKLVSGVYGFMPMGWRSVWDRPTKRFLPILSVMMFPRIVSSLLICIRFRPSTEMRRALVSG